MNKYIIFYKLRENFLTACRLINNCYWQLMGLKLGKQTKINKPSFTWPHKITIGDYCIIEKGCYFKHDGPYTRGKSIKIGNHVFIGSYVEFNIQEFIEVGDYCLIASGSKFIDHDHGTAKNQLMVTQDCPRKAIGIDSDVWIGANAVILKGVHIGKGAIIAAGAIVNQSVPSYEIWGGIPAKKIGERK